MHAREGRVRILNQAALGAGSLAQHCGLFDVMKGRGYVGTKGFKVIGKEPIRAGSLIGVEDFEGSLGF